MAKNKDNKEKKINISLTNKELQEVFFALNNKIVEINIPILLSIL